MLHVAIIVEVTQDDVKVTPTVASSDKSKVEEYVKKQAKLLGNTQNIDIFEVEEIA